MLLAGVEAGHRHLPLDSELARELRFRQDSAVDFGARLEFGALPERHLEVFGSVELVMKDNELALGEFSRRGPRNKADVPTEVVIAVERATGALDSSRDSCSSVARCEAKDRSISSGNTATSLSHSAKTPSIAMRHSCLMTSAYSAMMLSMFYAALRPRIATEQHKYSEPLMEPVFDSRPETAVSSTVFVTRGALSCKLSMAAMTTRGLGDKIGENAQRL